ncbi:hypothetical protein LR002_02190 [Candidatus Gracilibacteria bacterium]|nr:hypothetical protein [Candidatus Gracilibacteria bacterium]
MGTEFDEILIPLSLAGITEIERKVLKKYGRKIDMDFLGGGEKIFIENEKIFCKSRK